MLLKKDSCEADDIQLARHFYYSRLIPSHETGKRRRSVLGSISPTYQSIILMAKCNLFSFSIAPDRVSPPVHRHRAEMRWQESTKAYIVKILILIMLHHFTEDWDESIPDCRMGWRSPLTAMLSSFPYS